MKGNKKGSRDTLILTWSVLNVEFSTGNTM